MYYCEVDGQNTIMAAHMVNEKEGLVALDLAAEFAAGNVYIGVDRCIEGAFVPASPAEREAHMQKRRDEFVPPEQPEAPGGVPPEFGAKVNIMFAMAEGDIAEALGADDIIAHEMAFPEWGGEPA